jgi:hypothetical protein
MIWLFMAVWINGHSPSDYKMVAKIGPFDDYKTCYSAGALSANVIQSKDEVSNALGACISAVPIIHTVRDPRFLDFKPMWDMVCASVDKPDLCWLKNGQFIDPLREDPRP